MTREEFLINEGRAFIANEKATLGGGASRKYHIQTPWINTGVELSIQVYATADVTVVFSEGSDRVAGTAITAYNRDRTSSKTAALAISHTPTGGSSDGTALISFTTPSTGEVWPLIEGNRPLKLKRGTKYTLVITDVAGGCTASTTFCWTEEVRFTAIDGFTTTTTTTTTTTSTSSSSSTSTTTTAPP